MTGISSSRSARWGIARNLSLTTAAVMLAACGGGSSSSSSTPNYTIGGTITGLTAGSVVLENGSDTVTVSAGANTWVFPQSFSSGSDYAVIVATQPTGLVCYVTGGETGTLTGDVANVTVTCSDYLWTWEGGLNAFNAGGVYGTQGMPAAQNLPGAREQASTWSDSSGTLWLFGGLGYGSGALGDLSDLWQYSPSTGQWTWVSGPDTVNGAGVYGTLGTSSASNQPGARQAASSWVDSAGNLWLFGGYGYDSSGANADLNDLWQYSPSTGQWTWVGGQATGNGNGIFGTQGSGSTSYLPGAREGAASWIDSAGNLWLFGGYGHDSTGAVGNLDDLWEYSPSTGKWTWVSGSKTVSAAGEYGTQGVAATGNQPGARQAASAWVDSAGNLWLFGGYGVDSTGAVGNLNDLWQYSPSTGEWTWIGGANTIATKGIYATEGVAAANSWPGARQSAGAWLDSSGNLWLFGGYGYDSTGALGALNDLWQFSPSSGQWTWLSGSNLRNESADYGTQGTASAGSVPGARQGVNTWIDASGNLWMFGGVGYSANGNGYLDDLWRYVPPQ